MLPFDPIDLRDLWLRVGLEFTINRATPGIHPVSHLTYATTQVSSFVDGYLVGLSNELKATAEKHVIWMETQPEPDRVVYADAGLTEEVWRDSVFEWRLSLGVCKWLSRSDRAFDDLTAAIAMDWQGLDLASALLAPEVHATRRNFMSFHLATALAADAPLIGLKIYEATSLQPSLEATDSAARFGHWACHHLIDGGTHDETFVTRGRDMLTENLLPKFYEGRNMIEAALWLKAIYFDSGTVQTAEQAIAKAYDSMPGMLRPDFIPT
jgi:hypothetical protein